MRVTEQATAAEGVRLRSSQWSRVCSGFGDQDGAGERAAAVSEGRGKACSVPRFPFCIHFHRRSMSVASPRTALRYRPARLVAHARRHEMPVAAANYPSLQLPTASTRDYNAAIASG